MNTKITTMQLWVEPVDENVLPPLKESGNDVLDAISVMIRNIKSVNILTVKNALNIPTNQLNIIVKHSTGMYLPAWIAEIKMLDAKWLLLHSSKSCQEITNLLGFASYSSFYNFFRRHQGVSPFVYRKRFRTKEPKSIYRLIDGKTVII